MQGATGRPRADSHPVPTLHGASNIARFGSRPNPLPTIPSSSTTANSPSRPRADSRSVPVMQGSTNIVRSESRKSVPPDVISYFDPASVGGGGPLRRITTAQREREQAEARERAAEKGLGRIDSIHEKDEDLEPEHEDEHHDEDEPDGGYGWVVLACCVTLAAVSMGWVMNFGVFQSYYATELFPSANTAYVSLIGSFMALAQNMVSFISGRLGDRYGFKRMLYAAAIVSWVGTFSAAFCNSIATLLVTQGIITGCGGGIALPLFMSLPAQWFHRRRGMASGIALSGAGLGGGVSTLVIRQLLGIVGHKKTLMIMSFINLGCMLIATFFIKTRETASHAPRPWIDRRVMHSSKFWSFSVSLILTTLGYGVPFVYTSQWVALRLPEAPPMYQALPITLQGFCLCIGRIAVGSLADYLGPINTYILVFVLSGLVQYTLWLTASTFASLCVFAVFYGLVAPGFIGLIPQIVVQLFGLENLATNVGLILLFLGPGSFACQPLAGAIFESTGKTSFHSVILVAGAFQFGAAIVACWARFRTSKKWKAKV